nr:hypothetical protein [Tanacetum cinerariifolium]
MSCKDFPGGPFCGDVRGESYGQNGRIARVELTFEAEELLLTLAGAEDGSFIMTPFEVSALNVDFDFKIDLIVFGPEIGSTLSNFFSRGRRVLQIKDLSAESYSVAEESLTATKGLVVLLYDSARSFSDKTFVFTIKALGLKSLNSREPISPDFVVFGLNVFGRSKTYVSAFVKEIDYVQLGIFNQAELKLQPRAFFSFCITTYTKDSGTEPDTSPFAWLNPTSEAHMNDNEMVEVKVLMTLAEGNDAVSKEGARNGEWVKISMRKMNL